MVEKKPLLLGWWVLSPFAKLVAVATRATGVRDKKDSTSTICKKLVRFEHITLEQGFEDYEHGQWVIQKQHFRRLLKCVQCSHLFKNQMKCQIAIKYQNRGEIWGESPQRLRRWGTTIFGGERWLVMEEAKFNATAAASMWCVSFWLAAERTTQKQYKEWSHHLNTFTYYCRFLISRFQTTNYSIDFAPPTTNHHHLVDPHFPFNTKY